MKRALLDALLDHRAAKRPVVVATHLASGEQRLIDPTAEPAESGAAGSGADAVGADLLAAVRAASRADRSTLFVAAEAGGLPAGEIFLQVCNPPLRLIIVGAVHIAQALGPMARMAGFEVTVVDPRRAFASAERFPDVARITEWPDEALAGLALDRRSAVVTLTHDPKLDEPALTEALASDAFYIGALGSTRTQARRLDRLRQQGLDDTALARIHGPVGLAIGARSAAEIAVSILAELIAALRGGPGDRGDRGHRGDGGDRGDRADRAEERV